MDFLNKDEYIYMDGTVRMSKQAMGALLYAVFKTKAAIPATYVLGEGYTSEQDRYNNAEVKIHIHPSKIAEFEERAKIKLRKPIQVKLN